MGFGTGSLQRRNSGPLLNYLGLRLGGWGWQRRYESVSGEEELVQVAGFG